MLFEQITDKNIDKFINLYNSLTTNDLNSFRYFTSRGINHVLNIFSANLVIYKNEAVAYFHIDIEDNIAWFGIFVTPHAQGHGFSRLIIEKAQTICKENRIQELLLSVDKNNSHAISAYNKKDFVTFDESNDRLFMKWGLKI